MIKNEQKIHLEKCVPPEMAGKRLDQALALLFPDFSRSQLQQWIKQGGVQINDQVCIKMKQKVIAEQAIKINAKLEIKENWEAQDIPLDIIFEDEAIIIINKPPGLVVHPGAGNPDNTLVNALLFHNPNLKQVPRAGVIHRLDKDTSGLLVIAKTTKAHNTLIKEMKTRTIQREYQALIKGLLISGGSVDAPIGRHSTHRTKMAVVLSGRPAITHYRIGKKFKAHCLLDIQLETGRTHQIRVHMNHIKHPIVGDPVYGKHYALPVKINAAIRNAVQAFPRQALHAHRLRLAHPTTGELLTFEAPIPTDLQQLITILEENS